MLVTRARVRPGDWVIGGPDGVIVVPQEIAMEALEKAEGNKSKAASILEISYPSLLSKIKEYGIEG